MKDNLIQTLITHQRFFKNISPFDLNRNNLFIFDFTTANRELASVDIKNEHAFTRYIFNQLEVHDTPVGIGRYNEDRVIYKKSSIFSSEEDRSVHLGIDLWMAARTPVYAPVQGTVHSFSNNDNVGDYGPTIILEHHLSGCRFYTLYGHLSSDSLKPLKPGMEIRSGAQLGWLGEYHENVHWPPHLHFQIIGDMNGYSGDFPGVCSLSKRAYFLNQCPNPNLILNIDKPVSCTQ